MFTTSVSWTFFASGLLHKKEERTTVNVRDRPALNTNHVCVLVFTHIDSSSSLMYTSRVFLLETGLPADACESSVSIAAVLSGGLVPAWSAIVE